MLRPAVAALVSLLATTACSRDPAEGGARPGGAGPGPGSSAGAPAAAGSAAGGSAAAGSAGAAAASAGSAGPGSGSAAAAPPAAKPASVAELIQRSAPAGARVAPAELTVDGTAPPSGGAAGRGAPPVDGVELFTVTDGDAAAGDPRGVLVGVIGGIEGKVVEGSELLRAVIERKPPAATLARIALQVSRRDAELLEAPADAEQRKAKVRAPRYAGKVLEFWVWTRGTPRLVERGTLDRTTGALDIATPPALRAGALDSVMRALGSPDATIDPGAIRLMVASCGEERIRATLVSTMSNHPRIETRSAVADAIHRCGPPVIQPLIHVMEHDRALQNRSVAASSLGKIGDGRARPALAKAAKSEDANLAWAAKKALEKLK